MPFSKSLPPASSSSSRSSALRLIDRQIVSEPAPESNNESETSRLTFPHQERSGRTVPGAVSRLKAEAVAFAAHAGSAVPNAPIAIVSWLIAEFFAGCAAYAEAMYPMFPLEDDPVDRANGIPTAASRPRGAVVPFQPRNKPGSHVASRTELMSSPEPAQTARSRWHDSFCAAAIALFSKARAIRGRRRAAMELETLDDRTLGDIWICRGDIEAVVRQESRWE